MWLIFVVLLFENPAIGNGFECDPTKAECEIWLSIEEKLTMTWGKVRVYAHNGKLYKFDETPTKNSTEIPFDEVITMDGYQRPVIAVNGSVPGPQIITYENQKLIVHVTNHLMSKAITIHWHGMHMRGTNFMDGVPFVTQRPITSGQSFTYKFVAFPSGTFWYHSHMGGQRADGLFGALIIKRKTELSENVKHFIMHVGDWFHESGSTLHTKMEHETFRSEPGFRHSKSLDGVYFSPVPFKSAHIEGRGRYTDKRSGTVIDAPLKEYIVHYGSTYRFRVINTGMAFPFRVSIDRHKLIVISTDGFDVQPRSFESIVINPGERYDFLLQANQTENNYWIRVDGLEANVFGNNARGILRYADSNDLPTSSRELCTRDKLCYVLNCPFSYYPKDKYTICVKIDELRSKYDENLPVFDDSSVEQFLNWVKIPGGMGVNGKLFKHLNTNQLLHDEDQRLNCNKGKCGDEAVCKCHHQVELPFNKTIQIILTNHGKGAVHHHPIHIHGHSFYILKLAYGKYDEVSALKLNDNFDINCLSNKLCNNPQWRNTSWKGNNIPGLNLKNPPRKDTLIIPAGAYAVLRFRSDNPGKWFAHCHNAFHLMHGMAMIFNEAQEHQYSPPRGFPECHDFQYKQIDDESYIKRGQLPREPEDVDEENHLLIIVFILAVLVIVEAVGIAVFYKRSLPKAIKDMAKVNIIKNDNA